MASHQTQGIQQLLAAEKRAAEKVAEARKRKTKRIKQARDEAQQEVELYRKERERLFKEYEAKYMGKREDTAAKIDRETEKQIEQLSGNVLQNKDQLIQDLIELVCEVNPEVHPNFHIMRTFNMI
ncbi:unnamed protein product [Brassicogethes aeneus]|uniref:V-type proton ATPase subunit G n=1 Tax=Brassicogethes aeneus TaxID=1431903 RepID=A0A9P0B0Z9_BRAAE|nr:unnamed protein product [Brassicogethes aeneus]